MRAVKILAGPHDCQKILKRVPFRQPELVRRQIAGDNVRVTLPRTVRRKLTEIVSAPQIHLRPDLLCAAINREKKRRLSTRHESCRRTGGMAAIAIRVPVDNVTT